MSSGKMVRPRLVVPLIHIRVRPMRPAAYPVNELGKPGEADGLAVLAVGAGEYRSARNCNQALARQGIKRPAARQASALNSRYFKEPPSFVCLASDVNEIELSGVGHGPLWLATGPGCLERES